jgi:hypothetical protein
MIFFHNCEGALLPYPGTSTVKIYVSTFWKILTCRSHQARDKFEPVCRNVLVPGPDASTVKTSQHFGKF